jgi:hypothetical protein
MKRHLLVIGFFILAGYFTAMGQTSKFEIGLAGGPGLSFFYGQKLPDDGFTPIVAGYAGAQFQYHFSRHYSLKTGLAYERKGSEFGLHSYDWQFSYIYHANYLTIPVLIQAEYGKNVSFYGNAGLYISYLLSQDYDGKNERSGSGQWMLISPDSQQDERHFDFGVCAEFGIKIKVSQVMAISMGVSDYLGLYNTEKHPMFIDDVGNLLNTETTTYNNAAYFILGCSYRFGLTKH